MESQTDSRYKESKNRIPLGVKSNQSQGYQKLIRSKQREKRNLKKLARIKNIIEELLCIAEIYKIDKFK